MTQFMDAPRPRSPLGNFAHPSAPALSQPAWPMAAVRHASPSGSLSMRATAAVRGISPSAVGSRGVTFLPDALSRDALDDIRDLVHKEQRERSESQQELHCGLSRQNEALSCFSKRLEEVSCDAKAADENGKGLAGDLDELRKLYTGLEEVQQRHVSELLELREVMNRESEHANNLMNEVQEAFRHFREDTVSTVSELQKVVHELQSRSAASQAPSTMRHTDSSSPALSSSASPNALDATSGAPRSSPATSSADSELMRKTFEKMLDVGLQESHVDRPDLVAELEKSVKDELTSLRGWVDNAVVMVVNRLRSMECTLHHGTTERSASVQEISDTALQSGDDVRTSVASMKAELEKLSVEVRSHMATSSTKSDTDKIPSSMGSMRASSEHSRRAEEPNDEPSARSNAVPSLNTCSASQRPQISPARKIASPRNSGVAPRAKSPGVCRGGSANMSPRTTNNSPPGTAPGSLKAGAGATSTVTGASPNSSTSNPAVSSPRAFVSAGYQSMPARKAQTFQMYR